MSRNAETNIANGILLAVGGINGPAMAWKQTVGSFRARENPDRIINVGVPGMADIMAVVPVVITPDMVGKTIGLAVGIEAKTATGKQWENQARWQQAFEKRGGIYLLARSPQMALQQVESLPDIILSR